MDPKEYLQKIKRLKNEENTFMSRLESNAKAREKLKRDFDLNLGIEKYLENNFYRLIYKDKEYQVYSDGQRGFVKVSKKFDEKEYIFSKFSGRIQEEFSKAIKEKSRIEKQRKKVEIFYGCLSVSTILAFAPAESLIIFYNMVDHNTKSFGTLTTIIATCGLGFLSCLGMIKSVARGMKASDKLRQKAYMTLESFNPTFGNKALEKLVGLT